MASRLISFTLVLELVEGCDGEQRRGRWGEGKGGGDKWEEGVLIGRKGGEQSGWGREKKVV